MTLYRKYRPKKFSELVGRDVISEILTSQIRANEIASAYLFSGTRGTGKTTMARVFAKSLNCEKRDKKTCEPCNKCSSCVVINEGRSQDLIEIDAASNRGIDEIRQLREHVRYVPANSPYKVYVIDEAHMLTKEAFNALLKTLEEPPLHVVFILATTELHKILETIFSRCQHFSFGKLSMQDVAKRLLFLAKSEGVEIEESVVYEIARRSGGSLRDAESLLGQIFSTGLKKITSKEAEIFLPKVGFSKTSFWISALILAKADIALGTLDEIEDGGINLVFFIDEALESARQMMIYTATQDESRLSVRFTPDEILDIKEILKNTSPERLRLIVVELLRASQDMRLYTEIPSLPIEIAVVLICSNLQNKNSIQDLKKNNNQSVPASSGVLLADKEEQPNFSSLKKDQNKNKNIESEQILDENASTSVGDLDLSHSLEEILDGWGEVLTKVKDSNHALNFVLGVARPTSIEGKKLEIGFKYRLHQEKISEIKNRNIVENIVKEVYGVNYSIYPVLKEDIELKNISPASKPESEQEDDKFVKAALEVFEGAELIS